jgi:T5orf172 domain
MVRRNAAQCGVVDDGGRPCELPVEVGSGFNLCDAHLWAAHDWVEREVGMTDLLSFPCVACGSRVGIRYPSGWICATCEWRVGETPDGEVAPVRVDVVYYLRFGDRIKIGTSSNPRARLAQLRFDELLAFERGGRSTEQRRHAQFAEHRFPGSEWFHANDALAAHIEAVAAGVTDPWDLHRRWLSEQLALRQSG